MKITIINSHINIFRVEPHGILMLAACLEREGYKVQVVDGLFEDMDYHKIKEFNPDLIGISVMTLTYGNAEDILHKIKDMLPDKKIVLGGVHPTTLPKDTLSNLKVDFITVGESERTIVELCEELSKPESQQDFHSVKGLAFHEGGKLVFTPEREFIKDLDSLPFPARHLLDMKKYLVPPGTIRGYFFKKVLTIITSRGCPFRCTYCYHNKTYRQRSVSHVIKELKLLKEKYDIEGVNFLDQDMLINKVWMKEFCKEMKKLDLYWSCNTRITAADEDTASLMKKARCLQIDFGLESGSDKILKTLKKDLTVERIRKGCAMLRNVGLRYTCNVLVGSPGETKEDLEKTYRLLKEIKPDFGSVNFITVLPGTELYENYINEGNTLDYFIKKKGLPYKYFSLTNLSTLSDEETFKYQKKFRNYMIRRKLVSLLSPGRSHFIGKISLYFLSNPKTLLNSLYKIVVKNKERRMYKIVYDLFYEMQRGFYLSKKSEG